MVITLVSICFVSPWLGHTIKTNYKFSDCWSRDMFNFLEKGLAIVFPPHFVHDFSRKILIILYSTTWPHSIVWLSSLLEILGNMCIVIIICFPVYDAIQLEINLNFLIKQFFQITKKLGQKFKYLKNK